MWSERMQIIAISQEDYVIAAHKQIVNMVALNFKARLDFMCRSWWWIVLK